MDLSRPYYIITLLEYMIVNSDNIATNMILNNLGYINVKSRFSNYLGYNLSTYDNLITSKEACTYLWNLYENKNNNSYYELIIEYMKNAIYHDRIDKNMDYNMVAHKIGDYNEYVNDIAIVYADTPYILTVYTKDLINAKQIITEISDIIYEYNFFSN